MSTLFSSTAYLYPNEHTILALTIFLVILVVALTATATICLSAVFLIGVLLSSYQYSRSQHQALIRHADRIVSVHPSLRSLVSEIAVRLQVEPIDIFIVPSQTNVYTFGLTSPKTIVLYGKLHKAITALNKLDISSNIHSTINLAQEKQSIPNRHDDSDNKMVEFMATHPMMIRHINQLRSYASTDQYKRLQVLFNYNR
jgi:hypothetical protein